MTRTLRSAATALVPPAAVAVAVMFASIALAPEAATAPVPTSTPVATATPLATGSPISEATSELGPWTRDDSPQHEGARGADSPDETVQTGDPAAVPTPTATDPGAGQGTGPGTDPGTDPGTSPAPVLHDTDGVGVDVDIDPPVGPGVLALSVDSASTDLSESDSTALLRRFVGGLPRVSVTDTRPRASVAPGAGWYVLASASDFTGSSGTFSGEHLGWTPRLLAGDADSVEAGPSVAPDLAGGAGVRDAVLLTTTEGSAATSLGSWSAGADLLLLTDPNVVPGGYRSTITLSLFE
ncbi:MULTISPECIES: hypothetical protein [unclassified Rathayibacter]|uniref:hypothetical protein n=1 Tax=unclassified Rathayibacter TaxID=2609250 RepID=UPI00188B619E|nr:MULTISPECIES: hypothetical protein [unclassified Rathayibacter]MBF4462919.1 hypothetical protein [Rathayibacter sp. VKM Ac-2879]MBF4504333.1 hypothetical protein [Rathayibacter sp. VKM Ac-2878]